MMTNAIAVKRRVRDRLADRPALNGVQVAYSYPARDIEREVIFPGTVSFRQEIVSMGGLAGPQRSEVLTVGLHIWVRVLGGDVEEADARTEELAQAVDETFADDPRLDDLDELIFTEVESGELGYAIDDDGVWSLLDLQLSFLSHL